MDEHSRLRAPILGVVCLGYLVLRLLGLDDSCLWFDEIFSVHAAEHTWSGLLWFAAQDLIHPPLFYLLLKAWISVGGEGLYWLRLFPVLFSLFAIVPFYLLCRELKLKFTTILFALIFFAVNGALIKYAQEVRMYSVLLFFSLVSMWLFARFFFRGKNIWILTTVNVLMIYTHYFGWFVVLAEVIAIFLFQRMKLRHVLIMLAIGIAAYVPWIWGLSKAAGPGASVGQNIGWIQRPGILAIVNFAFDAGEPFYFQQTNAEPTSMWFITIPLLVVLGSATALSFISWKDRERKEVVYLLTVLMVVPLFLAFILSWVLPFSIWGSRHLIVVFSPAFILVSTCVMSLRKPLVRNSLLALSGLIAAGAFLAYSQRSTPVYIWCAWETFGPRSDGGETSKLYAAEDLIAYHLWFAMRGKAQIVKLDGVPEMGEDTAYFLPRGFDEITHERFDELDEPFLRLAYRSGGSDAFISALQAEGYVLSGTTSIATSTGTASIATFRKRDGP